MENSKEECKGRPVVTQKPQYNLLVLGQSGAGKSTLINMFLNLAQNKQYQANRVIGIDQNFYLSSGKIQSFRLQCTIDEYQSMQSDKKEARQTDSQTQKCNPYRIGGQYFPYELTLIDTPGLGDTEGSEKDERNIEEIIKGISQYASSINGIVYAHRAGDCREDVFLKYYVHRIMETIPKKGQGNLIVAFTNVSNPTRIDAVDTLVKLGLLKNQDEPYFSFDNDCLLPHSFVEEAFRDLLPRNLGQLLNRYRENWENAKESFDSLMKHVQHLVPVDYQEMSDLYIRRMTLNSIIMEKQDGMKDMQTLSEKIQESEKIISQNIDILQIGVLQKILTITESVKVMKVQQKFVQQPTADQTFNTVCTLCKSNCHIRCAIILNSHLHKCQAIKGRGDGACGMCNCQLKHHGLSKNIYQKEYLPYQDFETRTSQKLVTDTDKVDSFNNEIQKQQDNVNAIKKSLQELENKMESERRKVVYLNSMIEQACMVSTNSEIYIQYIKYLINNVQKGAESRESKDDHIQRHNEEIDKLRQAAEYIKQCRENKVQPLSNEEKTEIEQLIDQKRKSFI